MHNATYSSQYDPSWMQQLASHYQWMRTAYPGEQLIVHFRDDLVYMSPYPWDREVECTKCEGIRYFQDKGYRVVAFIDNEPANLEAVAGMDGADDLLLPTSLTTDFNFDMQASTEAAVFQVSESGTSWVAGI